MIFKSIVITIVLSFFCAGFAYGQFTTASFGGTVTDNSGAVVPDATVVIRNPDTGFTQQTATNTNGVFLFSRLPVGVYEVRVTKQGFETYVQSGMTLAVNQEANKNITLTVGQISEQVTVQADAELVNTRNATSGQLIDQQRVIDSPERSNCTKPGFPGSWH